jgi:hypothetical protein
MTTTGTGNGTLTGPGTNNPTKLFIPQKDQMQGPAATMARVLENYINNLNAPPSASGGVWVPGTGTDSAVIPGEDNEAAGEAAIAYGHGARAYVAGSAVQGAISRSSEEQFQAGTIVMFLVGSSSVYHTFINGITSNANIFDGYPTSPPLLYLTHPTISMDIDIVYSGTNNTGRSWWKLQAFAMSDFEGTHWVWPGGVAPTATLVATDGIGTESVKIAGVPDDTLFTEINLLGEGDGNFTAQINFVQTPAQLAF